ncbi:MAG: HAMP domain-containing sensor histidine kinase, partial [Bacteroidota bacterium]
LYEKQNKFSRAYLFLRDHVGLKDSLRTLRNDAKMEEIRKSIAFKDKEIEIANLKIDNDKETARNERQQLIILLGAIGSGLVLILTVFLYRSDRKRKKANIDLARLNREKDGLLSMVAHDLKAPLTKTAGLIQLLMSTSDGGDPQQSKILNMALGTLDGGQNLIRDLLALHQLGAEEKPKTREILDLSEFVSGKVAEFSVVGQKKGIEVEFQSNGSTDTVHTQPDYLGRVLDNLISNAVKFTPRGGTVRVKTSASAQQYAVSISDTGPGFSEADKRKMYGNFQRLTAQPTAGESSSGLGLAIVKLLVSKLDGQIQLESEAGKGATFHLTFATSAPPPSSE